MRKAAEKLNSKNGVTIIMALVFFLIAAIIGSVVITAASSNAGRLTHMRGEQQAYLTVSSAAKLVRDEVNGIAFVGTEKTGEYPTYEFTGSYDGLGAIVYSASLDFYNGAAFAQKEFLIKSDAGDINAALTGIDTILPNTTYALVFVFENGDEDNPYSMTLTVPFSYTEIESSETIYDDDENATTVYTTVTTYAFGAGTITRGGSVT